MNDAYGGAQRVAHARTRAARNSDQYRRISPPYRDISSVTTLQSGLPLFSVDGRPVAPEDFSRLMFQLWLKRHLVDAPLALLALMMLLPLLVVVALAIKLSSPGPVLFAQRRVGLGGSMFRLLKFRTMHIHACDEDGQRQVVTNDDRVTPVGRLLRATSIDELPQLWNVIVGDMALVGPRPLVPNMRVGGRSYHDIAPYYDFRHMVRPGLTGWAQANGLRGPIPDAVSALKRIDHDCAYVQNLSLGLDVRIILRTIAREFLTGSGV